MKKVILIWILFLTGLTGYGVWATFSQNLIDYADDFRFSLREESASGRRPLFFPPYFQNRGPRGGGFGYGK